MENLDELDIKILHILQNDARVPAKTIAEQVYVSAPTVSARIDEMKKNGVIKGYYTEINPAVFGSTIKAYIDMEVAPAKKEELYEYIRNCEQVIECSRVTGEYSLLMEVLFRSTEDMDRFINLMQHYGRTKTQIVFSTVVEHRGVILSDKIRKK